MVTSLAEKTKPQYTNTVYIEQKQNKPKPILCLSKKKKKKPKTEPLYQNQTKKTPILAHRHHSSLAPCRRRSPLIVDRRR